MSDYTLEEVLDYIDSELNEAYESVYNRELIYEAFFNDEITCSEALSLFEEYCGFTYDIFDEVFTEASTDSMVRDIKKYIESINEVLSKYKNTGELDEKLAKALIQRSKSKVIGITGVILVLTTGAIIQIPAINVTVGLLVLLLSAIAGIILAFISISHNIKFKKDIDNIINDILDDVDEFIDKVDDQSIANKVKKSARKLKKVQLRLDKKIAKDEMIGSRFIHQDSEI